MNNEFKGTKGKWFVNERFLQVGTKKDNDKSVLNDGTICRFHVGTKNYQSDKETAYNALLISKAPEILEKIKLCLTVMETYEIGENAIQKDLKKLIQEATTLK